MKPLIIKATDITPQVYFNLNEQRMELRGRCFPTNPAKFFIPLINWMNENLEKEPVNSEVEIKLEHYNTGAYIQLLAVFNLLAEKNSQGHNLKVLWYVETADDEGMDNARSFKDVVDLPFDIKHLPSIDFSCDL